MGRLLKKQSKTLEELLFYDRDRRNKWWDTTTMDLDLHFDAAEVKVKVVDVDVDVDGGMVEATFAVPFILLHIHIPLTFKFFFQPSNFILKSSLLTKLGW